MACGFWPAYVTAIPLGRRLPGASSNLPERPDPDTIPKRFVLARKAFAPFLFGLAPGGVCRAAGVTAGAVRSYRTVSPLPRLVTQRAAAVCSLWHCPWARTRRTLSGTACPWSPDFPPRQPFGFAGAAVRPTDRTGMGSRASAVKSQPGQEATTRRSKLMTRAATVRGRFRWTSRSCKVVRVEASQTPSMRSGRKCRWNAVTTSWVAES